MDILDIRSLVREGLIPSNASLIKSEVVNSKCTPLSRVISQDKSVRKFSHVVIDNPVWVVFCKGFGIYSCDGEYVYVYDSGAKELTRCLLKDKLIPIETLKLAEVSSGFTKDTKDEFEEDLKMADVKDQVSAVLNDLIGDAPAMVGDSNTFSGVQTATAADEKALKEKEAETKRDAVKAAISAGTQGVELADLSELRFYNQKHSEFIGWLTTSPEKNRAFISSKRKVDPETNKVLFAPSVPESLQQEFIRTGKASSKDIFLYDTVLNFKQNAPGPLKYGVIKVPANGIVKLDKIAQNEKISVDSGKSDMVLQYLTKDQLVTFVNIYMGDFIKECPITHADPGHLTVGRVGRSITNKDGLTKTVISARIKSTSSKTLLQPNNYFPLTVNDTVKLSEVYKMGKEDLEAINAAFFHTVFNNANTSYGYNNLSADVKSKIRQEDGVITSNYFDPKAMEKLPITGWFTKDSIADPEIPVKVKFTNPKDGKVTYRFVKYDVTKPDAKLERLNPFTSGKYDKFIQACGEGFTQASLIEAVATANKSNKAKKEKGSTVTLSADQTAKMALELLGSDNKDGISGLDLGKGFDKSSMEQLNRFVLDVTLR